MAASSIQADVIIVGAGPTGLSLACQLVRFGINFIILDKKEGPTQLSKALGVHARTLEIYEQLGIAEEAVARGAIADKVRIIGSTNGHIYDGFSLAEMGQGMSPFPYMLVLEQSKNEEILYEYLKENGREVRWNTTLDDFQQDSSGVSATITAEGEEPIAVTAQYLVGCDGASSIVRKRLGFSFEGDTEERLFYVADSLIEVPEKEFDRDALHGCFARDAFLFFFPIADDTEIENATRWRILGNLPEDTPTDSDIDMSDAAIEQRIQEITKLPLKVHATKWSSTYRVHTRRVDRFFEGRCFLAGDAAHVHTPAGGQGMNTGIQDAYNLAWKLALVLKKQADEVLLATYNTERLENAKNLVESTDKMFELEAGSNWFVGLVRAFLLPPLAKHLFSLTLVQRTLFSLVSQIGISYPDSALSLGESKAEVKAGDRLPYFTVEGDTLEGESIYRKLKSPKFHLLTFTNKEDKQKTEQDIEKIGQQYEDWLDCAVLPLSKSISDTFEVQDSFSLLIRPDNHISFITKGDLSSPSLAQQLEQYFSLITGKQ